MLRSQNFLPPAVPLLTHESTTMPPQSPISAEDGLHLHAYESKLQLVRDYTRGVALGFQQWVLVDGLGGIAKSYTVLGELDRLGVDYKLFNSRMSGRGLVRGYGRIPASVHVLEDMEGS